MTQRSNPGKFPFTRKAVDEHCESKVKTLKKIMTLTNEGKSEFLVVTNWPICVKTTILAQKLCILEGFFKGSAEKSRFPEEVRQKKIFDLWQFSFGIFGNSPTTRRLSKKSYKLMIMIIHLMLVGRTINNQCYQTHMLDANDDLLMKNNPPLFLKNEQLIA